MLRVQMCFSISVIIVRKHFRGSKKGGSFGVSFERALLMNIDQTSHVLLDYAAFEN